MNRLFLLNETLMYNMLIADADVDAWFKVNALLRRYLFKANFVTNLGLARQSIDKEPPSMLFIDNQLLDNSARDFIKFIKSKYPKVKIILINSLGSGARRNKPGADLEISRPIIPEIIERAIINLLKAPAQAPFPS
jgi:DNA-binding NtrC family response regulator